MYFIKGCVKVMRVWCQVMFAPPCRSCYPYITVITVDNYEANDFGELLNVVTGGEEDLCSLLKFVMITIKKNQMWEDKNMCVAALFPCLCTAWINLKNTNI